MPLVGMSWIDEMYIYVCMYVFIQQIYLIIFLYLLTPSPFIPPENVTYCLTLPFLVHKIFTFYIHGVLNCKCPAAGPKS